MWSWGHIVRGKHWVEVEAILLSSECDDCTLTTNWTVHKSETSTVHNLTLSNGLVDATIPFPSNVLKIVYRDSYVQRRIRHRLKKTLRFLILDADAVRK